jgi:hypothetical protein
VRFLPFHFLIDSEKLNLAQALLNEANNAHFNDAVTMNLEEMCHSRPFTNA